MKKIFCLTLSVTIIILTAVLTIAVSTSSSFALSSESEFTLQEIEGKYHFRSSDGSVTGETATIAESFREIASLVSGNVIVNFENVTSSENIVLSDNRFYVVKGSFYFEGQGSLFTLKSGASLRISGAVIGGTSTLIKTESGSYFEMESGTLSVRSENASVSTLIIYGKAVIKSGIIVYEGVNGNTGAACQQGGADSEVRFTGEGSLTVKGNTAYITGNGKTYIDGGNFYATEKTSLNTGSGYALDMQSDSFVRLNGGDFDGVSPDNTVYLRGNANSVLDYEAGTVHGEIKIASGRQAAVSINGRTMKTSLYGYLRVYSEDGILLPEKAIAGYINTENGYRFKGWQVSNGSTAESNDIYISTFPQGSEMVPICSNFYSVTLFALDESVTFRATYGTKINLTDRYGEPLNGYVIEGWTDAEGKTLPEEIVVEEDVTAFAVMGLSLPEIILPNISAELIYDGEAHSFEADYSHPLKGELTAEYVYEKSDTSGNFNYYSAGRELVLLNVSDSGVFRVRLSLHKEGIYCEAQSESFEINIGKAVYKDITYPSINGGKYSVSAKLSDYALSEGFFWKYADISPTVPQRSYEAYYLSDPVNYHPYYLNIELILEKADLTPEKISLPSEGRRYEGKTIGEYAYLLPQGWSFSDDAIIPNAGQNFIEAIYNIDSDNYNDFVGTVEFWLEKGIFTEIKPLEISVDYFYNLTEYHVLFENYDNPFYHHSVNPYVAMRNKLYCGTYTVSGVYYNSDVKNYNDYLTKIIIIVEKSFPPAPEKHPDLTGVYSSEKTLADYELQEFWRWADDGIIPQAGKVVYKAYYNPDPDNYLDTEQDVTLNVSKATLPEDSVMHGEIKVLFSENLRLYSLFLENGFSWISEDRVLCAGEYLFEAEYLKNDNYYPYKLKVKVTVEKISYDISTFILEDKVYVYDGTEKTLTGEGALPEGVTVEYVNNTHVNAGKYAVRAVFTTKDDLNYNQIADRTAFLTIEKAESVICGESVQEVLYDGKEHSPELTVANGEQTICYESEYKFVAVGSYTVRAYTFESANFKRGSKEITFRINPEYVFNYSFEEGLDGVNLPGRIYEKNIGISAETEISIKIITSEKGRLLFEILLDGEVREGSFAFLIMIPQEYREKAAVVNNLNGEVAFEISGAEFNGKYVAFSSNTTGLYEIITLENPDENVLQWWGWLLLASAVCVVASASVITILKLRRKSAKKDEGQDK